jgi:hypothetical protein
MDDLEYSFEEYTKETENDTKTIEEQIIPEI